MPLWKMPLADGSTWTKLDRLADENNEITHLACCICFEWVLLSEVYEDETGKWDMCKPCGVSERG